MRSVVYCTYMFHVIRVMAFSFEMLWIILPFKASFFLLSTTTQCFSWLLLAIVFHRQPLYVILQCYWKICPTRTERCVSSQTDRQICIINRCIDNNLVAICWYSWLLVLALQMYTFLPLMFVNVYDIAAGHLHPIFRKWERAHSTWHPWVKLLLVSMWKWQDVCLTEMLISDSQLG